MDFSHKRHTALKIKCAYCHTTVETGVRASFPAVGKCMICHRTAKQGSPEIRRLAMLGDEATPFPVHQVYTVPDFVTFSHARHHKAAVECQNCHGNVMDRDVIVEEVPVSMKGCVDCHKSRGASRACNICHELGQ